MSDLGLYVHVPFCRRKCPYCDFYSVGYREDLAERYADAVVRNLRHYDERYDTVYFGGGTPILMARELPRILAECDIAENAEITVECNPCEMDAETLRTLFEAGVNRLSVGVQSAVDCELRALGRAHTFERARQGILAAHEVGFCDISADIMLGVPEQDLASLTYTIKRLSELPVTHVSAYLLKIEPNTAFGKKPPVLPDEDKAAELYLAAARMLGEVGFAQYEISNFAKGGLASRHNLKYWRRGEYLGIGAAAHSFYGGKRFAVARDLRGFIDSPRQIEVVTDEAPDEFEERVMLGLRLSEGIPRELWERVRGALPLIPEQYYKIENERLALTAEGFLVSNGIISTLLAHLEGA
ncbi:MAG: radical SAM family heme chaperone HemW [Lachnospiraceae bacterium]|nr:radical SAM family heme chaperone HemW [Ruminococcus sp.]MCM1276097.1 radical SAM family heme chaperone HemW [Lachnospiraceae bacterium]